MFASVSDNRGVRIDELIVRGVQITVKKLGIRTLLALFISSFGAIAIGTAVLSVNSASAASALTPICVVPINATNGTNFASSVVGSDGSFGLTLPYSSVYEGQPADITVTGAAGSLASGDQVLVCVADAGPTVFSSAIRSAALSNGIVELGVYFYPSGPPLWAETSGYATLQSQVSVSVTDPAIGNSTGCSIIDTAGDNYVGCGSFGGSSYNILLNSSSQIRLYQTNFGGGPSGGPFSSGTTATPSWGSSISTPWQTFKNVGRDVVLVVVASAGALLITFPAQLFNLTLDENYEDVLGFWRRRFAFLRIFRRRSPSAPMPPASPPDHEAVLTAPTAPAPSSSPWLPAGWRPAAAVIAIGALLGTLLSPQSLVSAAAIEHYIGVFLAFLVSIALSWMVTTRIVRPGAGATMQLHALPFGLVIGAACVLVSRVIGFQPGYLYGVVVAATLSRPLTEDEDVVHTVVASLATLALSVVAWIVWIPVHPAFAGGGFFREVASNSLAAIFGGGIVGVAISLTPIRFLPGFNLFKKRRLVWFGLEMLALFAVVAALALAPSNPGSHSSPVIEIAVLFVVFMVVTMVFRDHYVDKWRRAHHLTVSWWERLVDIVERHQESDAPTSTGEVEAPTGDGASGGVVS